MSNSSIGVGEVSRGHEARLVVHALQMVCPQLSVRGSLSRQLKACLQLVQESPFLRAEMLGL